MQKALFADERVKKISEDPGNQAFLRTLEDQGSGDEMDFIDVQEPEVEGDQSQSQSQEREQEKEKGQEGAVLIPNSQPVNRAPAHMRRTKNGKKASDISDIRESLSSLLDEPSAIAPTELGSESEGDDAPNKENIYPPKGPVRDRITRGPSASIPPNARRGFGPSQSFRAPSLLRKATSSSSDFAGGADMFGEKIKKGAGRGSGVVKERREGSGEVRRRERRMKGAEERLRAAKGLFGGTFE